MTADIEADKILRLRPNRCLWMSPPPPDGKKGRPKKHGEKFKLSDPTTHPLPDESLFLDDPTLGVVEIDCWRDLHFRETPDIPMMLVRVQRKGENAEPFKPLWLACLLLEPLSLEEIWRANPTTFRGRSLESLRQTKVTLDFTPTFYRRGLPTMERVNAPAHLAIMVSPALSYRSSSALAETSRDRLVNPRSRGRFFRHYFSGDWLSRSQPETPRKIARFDKREKTHPSNSLSDRQKASF
jgi:hypothetical protein